MSTTTDAPATQSADRTQRVVGVDDKMEAANEAVDALSRAGILHARRRPTVLDVRRPA